MLAHKEPLRYGMLKKEMTNISDAVFAVNLKEHDMITRVQYDEIPPRVEYSLTEKR